MILRTIIIIILLFSILPILNSCQPNSSRPVKIYHILHGNIKDTTASFYHLTEVETGWEEIITGQPQIEDEEVIQVDYSMYWNSDKDQPLLDLEESCLVMSTVPDTVQTENGAIVIKVYSEECGPIDGLIAFYHSPVLGPVAAVYTHGRIDVFEYPGYEELTLYILQKIEATAALTVDKRDSIFNSTPIVSDTLPINKLPFVQQSKDGRFYSLLNLNGDTIIDAEDFYHHAEVMDIDEDGLMDLRVFIVSNSPTCDSYLFDPKSKTLRKIDYCNLDIKKISGTEYYHSYNRAGCADAIWESHLSKIINYRLVDFGYMYGQGCENPQIIEIFKYARPGSDEKTKIATFSYTEQIKEFDEKWAFIEKYWAKNYWRFE